MYASGRDNCIFGIFAFAVIFFLIFIVDSKTTNIIILLQQFIYQTKRRISHLNSIKNSIYLTINNGSGTKKEHP